MKFYNVFQFDWVSHLIWKISVLETKLPFHASKGKYSTWHPRVKKLMTWKKKMKEGGDDETVDYLDTYGRSKSDVCFANVEDMYSRENGQSVSGLIIFLSEKPDEIRIRLLLIIQEKQRKMIALVWIIKIALNFKTYWNTNPLLHPTQKLCN